MTLGKRIKELRLRKGWSLRRLERETVRLGHKVSNGYISQLENDHAYDINPSMATLDVIARALGTTISALLDPQDDQDHSVSLIVQRAEQRLTALGRGTDLSSVTKLTEQELASINDDDPDLKLVQQMAHYLNTTMHYLLGRTDDPAPLPGVQVAHHDPAKGVEPGDPMPPETQLIAERAVLAAMKEWGWDNEKT